MTLKSYLRMLLAAVTLLFVTSGCNDDDDKVGPPPSYSFSVAVSDVAQTEATVTVTPSNDQATYYYAAVKKAEFDTFESDAAYAQHILDNLKAIADKKVLPLSEYLATALVKGSAPQKITDLTAGTDYYAVALGMLTDGRFTSDLVKEAFKTDDAPEPELVISKAGGYFFGTSFGAFDNFTFWMSEDTVTEDMMDFTGEGTYLLFDLNVAVTGKATLPAGTFPVASGADAEENTIAPGADYGGGMMTGSAIVKINSDGTKNYLYIDGGALIVEGAGSSYVITAKVTSGGKEYEFKYEGGVSIYDTTGGGGDFELSIDVTNITATTATVNVTSSDETSSYYFDLFDEEDYQGYGGTPEGIAEFVSDLLAYYQAQYPSMTLPQILSQIVSVGNDSYDFDGLTPGTKYYTFAIGVDATTGATTTTAVVKEFTTQAGGEGDGPELTLTLRAGDANGANTDTKVYMGAYAPTATGAYYGVFLTSDVEKVLAQGASYDAIVTQNGTDMSTKDGWLDGLVKNPGIGVTFSGLDPATSYTCILKVTDSAGKSTTKHVAATTEGGGEASDAYKAWLGTWTLTSTSSEVNAAPLSFDVTFIQGVANSSYKLQGWGLTTIRDQSQILPSAKFDSATGNFEILEGQSLYTDPEDGSVLTLTGRALLQGKYYIINGGYPGFTGKLNADKNSATITLYQGSVDGMSNFTTSSMDFFWVLGQDIYWQKAAEGYTDRDYPIGPYTMTRKSSGASVSASKSAATILHASKLSSVLSEGIALSTSVKQNGMVFESQVAMPSSLVFDRPAAVYEASIGDKPLGLKKHFIKK